MTRGHLRVAIGVFAALAAAPEARAQTVTDQRVWSVVTVQPAAPANGRWPWTLEFITRSRDGLDALDVFSTRLLINHRVTPRLAMGGGFAVVAARPAAGGTAMEYRPTVQVAWSRPALAGTVALRTRVEARWIEGSSGPVGRLRQQVRYSRPIRQGSRVSLVVSDELFVHVNDTSRTARGIDQNRVSAGLGWPMGRLRLEASYLHQYSPGHRGARARSHHVLLAALTVPVT